MNTELFLGSVIAKRKLSSKEISRHYKPLKGGVVLVDDIKRYKIHKYISSGNKWFFVYSIQAQPDEGESE